MSKKKAQEFFAKKKETKGAMKEGEKKNPDTSKCLKVSANTLKKKGKK